MPTREIPRAEWFAFFESFSRVHYGWRVTVEALGRDFGAQVAARELALREIVAEMAPEGRNDVNILLGGGDAGTALTHIIHEPKRVFLRQTADGADQSVEVEHRDGSLTILTFKETLRPELVDGVAEPELVGSERK
jgi:hypothetical protein